MSENCNVPWRMQDHEVENEATLAELQEELKAASSAGGKTSSSTRTVNGRLSARGSSNATVFDDF